MESFLERVKPAFQTPLHHWQLFVASGAFLLGILGLAGSWLVYHAEPQEHPFQVTADELNSSVTPDSTASSSAQLLTIDVSGAVKKPGVYSLPINSRVFNALELAGGLSKNADLGFVQQKLNLADKISEGQKLFFPPIQKDTDNPIPSNFQKDSSDELISINESSAEELGLLPGIGEKLAQKIIDGRPYQNVDELKTKIKIGESLFNKIKDAIKI